MRIVIAIYNGSTYAAILAFPVTFLFPLAFGSTFTFKLSAVDDVVWNSSEGPRGAEEAALVVREEAPVEKAVALSMMAAMSKTAAMSLFMVKYCSWIYLLCIVVRLWLVESMSMFFITASSLVVRI